MAPAGRQWVALCLGVWLTACGTVVHRPSQTYAQNLDSASAACRRNPRLCAPEVGEQFSTVPEVPAASPPSPLPAPASAVPSAALSIAAAGRAIQVAIDATLMARIREALTTCADEARSEVLLKYFEGRGPTQAQCSEVVGVDKKGVPITRAMQLGVEQHEIALQCAQQRLHELKPGGFSISPRYRVDPRTGQVEYLPQTQVKSLLEAGRSAELRGSLEPDLVIHTGNPLHIQAIYDFKFFCVNAGKTPWRRYPPDHPYAGLTQKELYMRFLSNDVFRVLPRWGILE